MPPYLSIRSIIERLRVSKAESVYAHGVLIMVLQSNNIIIGVVQFVRK